MASLLEYYLHLNVPTSLVLLLVVTWRFPTRSSAASNLTRERKLTLHKKLKYWNLKENDFGIKKITAEVEVEFHNEGNQRGDNWNKFISKVDKKNSKSIQN